MNIGKLTLTALVTTLAYMFFMNRAIAPLTAPEIIAFELSSSVANTTLMIQEWEQKSWIGLFKLSLLWDIAYPILYASLIGLSCIWVSEQLSDPWKRTAKKLFGALALAAVLDFIENYAMYCSVTEGPTESSVALAFWPASLKFVIICAGILFFSCGLMMKMIRLSANRNSQ